MLKSKEIIDLTGKHTNQKKDKMYVEKILRKHKPRI